MIEIMNLKHHKPQHPWDVRVDRGHSALANLYPMMGEHKRDEVCDRYERYFEHMLSAPTSPFTAQLLGLYTRHVDHGKLRLFCWCAPKRCHADTIKTYLEGLL